jgi:hypothetical protein
MSAVEQAQHRATFRTRFGILRTAWPRYHIPDFPDTLPLEQIHRQYQVYVRHIHVGQEADQYKVYLVIAWLIFEFIMSKMGLNAGGFTVVQMRSMNRYDRLLIELGEENYSSKGEEKSPWPVWARILFMSLVNLAAFVVIKMLSGYIGEGMATTIVDTLSSYLSGTPAQPGEVLFGGQSTGAPTPNPNPLPGVDIPSLIGNLGSMFLRNTTSNAPTPAATATTPAGAPRFRPAYDE